MRQEASGEVRSLILEKTFPPPQAAENEARTLGFKAEERVLQAATAECPGLVLPELVRRAFPPQGAKNRGCQSKPSLRGTYTVMQRAPASNPGGMRRLPSCAQPASPTRLNGNLIPQALREGAGPRPGESRKLGS
ncbi:bactericidal permeability-increasing protein-like [Platysternon megacephalum]|uniref:Bactericidal permeability-increasing protein-like n=1 Tax=Platysternon megacephalum TaxID=55544 RepID=A0A4D9E1V8_9SAUR|nr:bactericidal permeability-increasing protein-like [Platysternon megacephalum]